jgi:hypothetical protein
MSLGWRVDILSRHALRYAKTANTVKLEMGDYPDTKGELEWIIDMPEH